MLVECSSCSAPLDVKEGKSIYKCNYCGSKNAPQQMRVVAQTTPQTWQPPKVWTPPAHAAVAGQTFKYHRNAVSMAVLLPTLLGLFIPLIAVFATMGGGGTFAVMMWDEASTLECGPNGELEIDGVDAKVDSGPVIEMAGNCKIEVSNSTLTGPVGIKGGANGHITLKNTTIKASEIGVEGGGNAKIKASDSKISGREAGIVAGGNGDIDLDATTVTSEETAIEGSNGEVILRGKSKADGGDMALRLGGNGKVKIRNSKVISKKGIAIEGSANNEVDCRDGTISGDRALKFTFNADLSISKCKVKGAKEVGRNVKQR